MQVIFSHGQESGPWGRKIQQLASTAQELGWHIQSVDYQDLPDPQDRSKRLANVLTQTTGPLVLVGSSMGGYVSLTAPTEQPLAGMFLLAPAIYLPGYPTARLRQPPTHTTIVHGWQDDIVPVNHSIEFARKHQCHLHLLPDGHRLTDSLATIDQWFAQFLHRVAGS